MSTKKTIFSQIMSLVSRYEFQKCVDRYKGDWHAKTFTCFDQFKVMSFAQFTDRSGLRDIEMTLEFCGKGLYHAGLISDQLIRLTGKNPSVEYPEPLRMVVYEDYATDNVYRFLTNNLDDDTLIVAELCRERWMIELFFKWVKQHLSITLKKLIIMNVRSLNM